MPNLTTGFPSLNSGDHNKDMKEMREWAMSLTDELRAILCNLDAGNVTEAGTVKAQNIDTAQAKIKDAQIKSLTADKLTAGTIDTGEITVQGESKTGKMTITGKTIEMYDSQNLRILIGEKGGNYIFTVQSFDENGKAQGIYMDDKGEVYMTGHIQTEKDCIIKGELKVGFGGNNGKGIEIYGDSEVPNADGEYYQRYAKITPYVSSDGARRGIDIKCDTIAINGVEIN